MRYVFSPADKTLPWSGEALPIVGPMGMPMDALSEALHGTGWRLADLQALVMRAMIASLEAHAERQGKTYEGKPSGITGEDEIRTNQLTVFATLRTAGYKITWAQACAMSINDFHAVADDDVDAAILANHIDDEDERGDAEDPQGASMGSAPGVDAEATPQVSESTGPQ